MPAATTSSPHIIHNYEHYCVSLYSTSTIISTERQHVTILTSHTPHTHRMSRSYSPVHPHGIFTSLFPTPCPPTPHSSPLFSTLSPQYSNCLLDISLPAGVKSHLSLLLHIRSCDVIHLRPQPNRPNLLTSII